jgi:hypothetical protein
MDRRSFIGRSSGALAAVAAMPVLSPLNTKQKEVLRIPRKNTLAHVENSLAVAKNPKSVRFFLKTNDDRLLVGPEIDEVTSTEEPFEMAWKLKTHKCREEVTYEGFVIALPDGRAIHGSIGLNKPQVKPGNELTVTWRLSV